MNVAARVNDAAGAHRHRVVVRISDALQAGTLVDDKGSAILGGDLEERRIKNVDAAAKTDQVHRSWYAAVNLKVRRADYFQRTVRARQRNKSQRSGSYRRKALTMRSHSGLELKDLAARKWTVYLVGLLDPISVPCRTIERLNR